MSNELKNFQKLMDAQRQWSDNTFDSGNFSAMRSIAISHHLQKESRELTEATVNCLRDPTEENFCRLTEEIADCQLLLLDIAAHMGFGVDIIISACRSKHEINKSRKWGKPDANGVVEHIR